MTAFNARRQTATAYDILAPEMPRVTQRRVRPAPSAENVVDADFVILRDTAAYTQKEKPSQPQPAAGIARTLLNGAERKLGTLSPDSFSALVAAACVGVFVLAGGLSGFFASEPAPVPVQPLIITHANLTPQEANGMKLLAVNGIVENTGSKTVTIPPIRADLMAGSALVASVVIDPPVASVKPGQSHGFATRIVHPGGKTPQLKVSFGGKDVPEL